MKPNAARAGYFLLIPGLTAACVNTPPNKGWEAGLGGGIAVGDGEPANDMTTFGVFARKDLGAGWAVRLAAQQSLFDFERPAKLLGIVQDPADDTADAAALSISPSMWLERGYRSPQSAHEWLWGVGFGAVQLLVGDADGDVQGGGTFDIETDPGTEVFAGLELGYRNHLSPRWTLELLARGEQHFADWSLEDQVSGATGSVGDYPVWAFLLGVSCAF